MALPDAAHSSRGAASSSSASAAASTRTESPYGVVIVALAENRLKEIGIAVINVRSAELILHQFVDSATYLHLMTLLHVYTPTEVLIPNSATELHVLLRNNLSGAGVEVVSVARKYFSEVKGQAYLRQLAHTRSGDDGQNAPAMLDLESAANFLCLAAAAALLKYIEFIQQMTFAAQSLRVSFRAPSGNMMIDRDAVRSLELVSNTRGHDPKLTLFGLLNHTRTLAGARLLRTNILSSRLECVDELLSNERLFFELNSGLSQVLDLDHLMANLVQIPKRASGALSARSIQSSIANIVYLKHQMEVIPKLWQALEGCKHEVLRAARENLQPSASQPMRDLLSRCISEDTSYTRNKLQFQTQLCFAVKSGLNGLLDVARKTYLETIEDLQQLAHSLRGRFNLPSLKLHYNTRRGYFLSLPASSAAPPLGHFVQIAKQGRRWNFSCNELLNLNLRARESLEEILLLTARVLDELYLELRKQIGFLFKLSDCVAMLDMLASFVSYVTLSGGQQLTRPEFLEGGPIAIKGGRHPLLEKVRSTACVGNDTYLDAANNFLLITGPNMSGKSTYLKQVALLTIMAHIGCYVPANFASFRCIDKLFCRMGTDDDMENNASSFMCEMRETAFIVQSLSPCSLILIDELGRSTGNRDGMAIAHALCEYLLSTKAFTLMATHYHSLCALEQLYPNAKNYHLQVELGDRYRPTYALMSGPTAERHYGLRLTALSGLPSSLVSSAYRLLHAVQAREKERAESEGGSGQPWRQVYQLANALLALRNSTLDNDALRSYLATLKEKYGTVRIPDEPDE